MCQGPGGTEDSICGVTEISDKSDWRKGGKFKPEHAGKWCCTKRQCRITLGVIADPKVAKQEAAPAPAPAAGSGLASLLAAAGTALSGGGAPPAAAAAAAPATAAAAAPQSAAAPQAGTAPAAAPPTEPAAAAPPPPDNVPPARTPLERQRDLLDTLQLPDGWRCGVAELPSGPHVYFWPSALAEQRWTTWRSPLDAPALCTAFKLEGHQEITKDDDSVVDEWRVYGEFTHSDEKYDDVSEALFTTTAWVSDDQVADDYLCQLYVAHQAGNYNPDTDREFLQYVRQYFDTLVENSKVASRAAMHEWLKQSGLETEMEQQQQARVAQMEQDNARYDAIQAVAAAPAERLAAIMAAAAAEASSAAAPPPAAAASGSSPAAPRRTRSAAASPTRPPAATSPAATAESPSDRALRKRPMSDVGSK